MISNHDRSGWFGASDVERIVGNWDTKTFEQWWLTKEGFRSENITTDAMLAGTYWEHRILESDETRQADTYPGTEAESQS